VLGGFKEEVNVRRGVRGGQEPVVTRMDYHAVLV